jgi:hypothetical protein
MCESAAIGDEETSSARDLLDACDHLVDRLVDRDLLVDDAVHRLGPDVLVVEDCELVVLGEVRGCSEFNGLSTVKPLCARKSGKGFSGRVSNQNRGDEMSDLEPQLDENFDDLHRREAEVAAQAEKPESDKAFGATKAPKLPSDTCSVVIKLLATERDQQEAREISSDFGRHAAEQKKINTGSKRPDV